MSRVRTIGGLFMREQLSLDLKKYDVPSGFKSLVKYFKTKVPIALSEDDYSLLKME